ncbi:hypothetical protein C2E23DRAFT_732037 [Lenzites betulinus]|nr:hypothetical protein C2E23DRAFT_732037 [Lenzites betulinus]
MFSYAAIVALLASAAVVSADPTPTAPGPGDVFKEGGQCTFTWDVDPTGTWTEMNVELMTGDNLNMIHVTTVATIDGTDAATTSFSYACPEVTPNSAIYFYQFTASASSNRTWTTRFTIAAADGTTTPPVNTTQPDGKAVPWGVGALVDPSTAVAAPSYLTGGTSAASSAPSASSAPAGSSASQSSAAAQVTPSASATSSKASAAPSSSASAGNTTGDVSASNTTSSNNNAAVGALALDGQLVRAAVALSIAALTFGAVL